MALLEPTNLLLPACAVIYAVIGELGEALILLTFVVGITLLDAIQQQRSSRALAVLARLSAPRVHLRREGTERELATEEVRLGDGLLLEGGDRVASDARVSESVGLSLDESLLTGESMPVEKANGEPILAWVAGGRRQGPGGGGGRGSAPAPGPGSGRGLGGRPAQPHTPRGGEPVPATGGADDIQS